MRIARDIPSLWIFILVPTTGYLLLYHAWEYQNEEGMHMACLCLKDLKSKDREEFCNAAETIIEKNKCVHAFMSFYFPWGISFFLSLGKHMLTCTLNVVPHYIHLGYRLTCKRKQLLLKDLLAGVFILFSKVLPKGIILTALVLRQFLSSSDLVSALPHALGH